MLVTQYALKFRTAVFVFAVVASIAGTVSYLRLPREGVPDITIPYVFVTALYEGTAPSEMEKLVTLPLEKSLNGLENVKEVRSATSEGVSSTAIKFLAGADIDTAIQRVKDKVDLARPDLPQDLDEPLVQGMNFSSDIPIFIFALHGDTDAARLKFLAESLQDEIELLPGVKEAVLSGTRERELRVEFDLARLAGYGVPLAEVIGRIARENVTVSAGNIELGGNKFQLRVPGEFELPSEISRLPIAERGGETIYLRDVARVVDTFKDVESVSRLNGQPSVSIGVKKRARENSVALIGQVKQTLDRFVLPPGVQLTVVMDESEYVRSMIEELENNVASGFILVIVVLFLFMGWRNSLFVAIAIPLSLLISFILMSLAGFTLNMIVLFSLVVAVGMLVDNAIVIVENAYRLRGEGLSRLEAARRGTAEVAWPVTTSTLTTVAAFWPLLAWPDIIGQFMSFLPLTLIVTLMASLLVALLVNPVLCSVWIRPPAGAAGHGDAKGHWFLRGYERLLRGALHHRIPVLLLGGAMLVFSILVYARLGLGMELFPDVEPRNAVVQVRFPQGTSIERTDAVLRGFEAKLPKYEDIKFYLSTAGASGDQGYSGGGLGTHLGSIHVEFKPKKERRGDSAELVKRIREDVGVLAGAEVKVEKQREGPPVGAPVMIEISGDDFETLQDLAAEVQHAIVTVPGLVDLQDDYEEALPELRFRVDRDRASRLGLSTDDIGSFLRTSIYGTESSKFRADEDEFEITVRLPPEQRNTLSVLEQILIPVPGGGRVPLSSLGSIQYAGGRGAINRKDRKRMITVTGSNQDRGVDKILADVRERLAKVRLPRGYAIHYAGDTQEMQESGAFLARAFLLALGLIVVILVIQFNSVLLPMIIMSSVVLSLIGVMWGLILCRMRFGVIMTGVGVVSLAGVVVNNAIILVDCVLQYKAQGLADTEAIVVSGRQRLRPVLLTAGTTLLGLIPMAIGLSLEVHTWPWTITTGAESSQWWAPMAVALIFGLGVATLLTLVLVPCMQSVAMSLAARVRPQAAASSEKAP